MAKESTKPEESATETKSKRGFASLSKERQREIARLGGKKAHERGTAHRFDKEEAREAGRKGGAAVSENRAHMAEIGRKGGQARGAAAQKQKERKSDKTEALPPVE